LLFFNNPEIKYIMYNNFIQNYEWAVQINKDLLILAQPLG